MDARILVIDDQPLVVRGLARALRPLGFDVTAADPAEARTLPGPFAVIVSDHDLGRENGLSLLSELKQRHTSAALVLMTGCFDLDLASRAITHHDITFVAPKPWGCVAMATLLRRALRVAGVLTGPAERAHALFRHGRRVLQLGRALSEAVGADATTTRAVVEAASLHDLSFIDVPDDVLLKPGPLADAERTLVRSHVGVGGRLLTEYGAPETASAVFAQHHEHWDGSGYPEGLSGERICLGARIFAVADALASLLSQRPYRDATSISDACSELERCAGRQFDSAVVQAAARLPRRVLERLS